MQIFVINLEKDAARRLSITGQLNALGLPFELVRGVFGAALPSEELAVHYDGGKAKWRMARSLVPAEIGCALSHLCIYRRMVDRAIPCALVLEDDVSLPRDLVSFLGDCSSVLDVHAPEVWLLSPAECDESATGARAIGRKHHVLPYGGGYFASSYLVTLPAARALLAELYPIGDVADCWKRLSRYRVVDIFVVLPPLVLQDAERFGSSTTADYRATVKGTLINKLIYKLRRARAILRDAVYAPYRRRFRPYAGIG